MIRPFLLYEAGPPIHAHHDLRATLTAVEKLPENAKV